MNTGESFSIGMIIKSRHIIHMLTSKHKNIDLRIKKHF